MLVITLRTVTFIVAWRWCSRRTISSAVVPCSATTFSNQPKRGGDLRVLIAKALEELNPSGCQERCPRQAALECRRAVGALVADTQDAVGQLIGHLPRCTPANDLLRQAAEVLDQEDAQGDRGRPQFADGQRLDFLVGAHHAPQALRVEAAVGVRDVGPGETEHSRVAGERPLGQLRQLAVVVRRKVVADLAQLLVDDREVVDQPLGRRRDRAFLSGRAGEHAVGLDQDATVVSDSGLHVASPARRIGDLLRGGERVGMLLEALDAEELGQDRLLELRL